MKRHRPTDPAADVRRLELAVLAQPLDARLHEQLGKAHEQLLRLKDHQAALEAICREQPAAFTTLLHLAAHQELAGDRERAAINFLRAIRTAQLRGFWLDENSTPPWLRTLVVHGVLAVRTGRAAMFQGLLEPMIAKYGADELGRVLKALRMYLELEPLVRADPLQRPSFLYIPDLPRAPVFPRSALPFAEWYESQTEVILGELRRVLADGGGIQPFHYDVPEERRGALTAGDWDAYFFFEEGDRNEAHHAACPETSAVLAQLPLDHVRQHGPEVCFSIMRPGAHILPHRGVTNARAVLHLGLAIPEKCALHLVGVQEVDWQVGRCFAFDDTYEHEAWNRSSQVRAILLADIWNPYLREAERAALGELVGAIGDFNRAAAPVPVPSSDPSKPT